MTTIDWTQPVETTEDPPRPVRVLATDRPGDFHVVVMHTDGAISTHTLHGTPIYEGGCRLRNVAPPKSEPVMIDFWINLYPTFSGLPFDTEEQANSTATANRVECRRVTWMSDGSPVPGEEDPTRYGVCEVCVEKSVKSADAWRTQCEQWAEKASAWSVEKDAWVDSLEEARQQRDDASARVEALQAEVERMKPFNRDVEVLCHRHGLEKVKLQVELGGLKDEAERMKPVVDAAVAWVLPELRGSYLGDTQRLIDTVRAYQQSPKKTAAEAVANVAEMMGPVKNCTTCRNSHIYHADAPCNVCADNSRRRKFMSQWEPRHD